MNIWLTTYMKSKTNVFSLQIHTIPRWFDSMRNWPRHHTPSRKHTHFLPRSRTELPTVSVRVLTGRPANHRAWLFAPAVKSWTEFQGNKFLKLCHLDFYTLTSLRTASSSKAKVWESGFVLLSRLRVNGHRDGHCNWARPVQVRILAATTLQALAWTCPAPGS